MFDTQGTLDLRRIKIAQVGIKSLRHPFFFSDGDDEKSKVSTVGYFSFSVALPKEKKGTHMSRFPTLLYKYLPEFSLRSLEKMTQDMHQTLETDSAFLSVQFPYFIEKQAPVSKVTGLLDVDIEIEINSVLNGETTTKLSVKIPVKSLCPCSKAISDFGAHSQRSHLQLTLWNSTVSIRDCIKIAEESASSALYSVLKREDEKFVTEQAYKNPRFVEDLVREAALHLKEFSCSSKFEVLAENFESIHNHNAWAFVSSDDIT